MSRWCEVTGIMAWAALLLVMAQVPATATDAWPQVAELERQPAAAELRRLIETAEQLGEPLDASAGELLAGLREETSSRDVADRLQAVLDPWCGMAIVVHAEGPPEIAVRDEPVELVEQGWRTIMVKIVNHERVRRRLRIESPNSKPLPHAPASEVASRWLSLSLHAGQPASPSLTGLPLEYRFLQVYSREAGDRQAVIEAAAPGPATAGGHSSIAAEWRFDDGAAGWEPQNQVELTTREGSLYVRGIGDDPFMHAVLPRPARAGGYVLRFWARAEEPGVGQLFWQTESRPYPDGGHTISFQLEPGSEKLYEVAFTAEDTLTSLRLDPNGVPGSMRIDWMELASAERGDEWTAATVPFRTRQVAEVRLRVIDDADRPAMACFVITDLEGRVYPPQSKRLAPDFFFQSQIYRGDGETLRLPPGEYVVHCSRGPESLPEVKQLVVGREPVELEYRVKRWVDPSRRGYWSGDHHIHAAGCAHYENPTQGVMPPDMLRHCMGEDLKVGCCLTWGPCFDFQKRFFTGRLDDASQYPYLIRYDVEVSGFGSHASGHLNLLRLTEQIPPGGDSKDHWPTLGLNTLRWAKRQGAVCGPAHSAIGLTRIVDRLPDTEGLDGPDGLPTYGIPAFDGIGANEFIMNVTHRVPGPDGSLVPAVDFISTMNTDRTAEWNMWYHVLNSGLRVRASGETDFPCITGERVGIGRVYVRLDGPLDFDAWCDGLEAGRSYVSDGRTHLMDFAARVPDATKSCECGVDESELAIARGETVAFTVDAAALREGPEPLRAELVVNGFPVAEQPLIADGSLQKLAFRHRFEASGWAAVRVFPGGHTNPIFVLVDGEPILDVRSAAWCLRCVERCREAKMPTYREQERATAEADYDHAEAFFRGLIDPAQERLEGR
jgi:hypothetical protein